MPQIILSYRRADSAAMTRLIFDRLIPRYGANSVFMDIDNIPFGTDFRTHIRESLLASDVLLAIDTTPGQTRLHCGVSSQHKTRRRWYQPGRHERALR